ncbi:unnamed protein product [Caenorhabditis auriculariae]|uniref:Uncharacterized protein n=1 Tax=Caenorhabditis auriculariae TaxID=2777116 RepID=A0A8S1H2Z5_9PELO|nr:unnamed protein product [Caenorhabditis auriculariae]
MLSDEASRKSVLVGRIIKNPYRQELHLQWIIELRHAQVVFGPLHCPGYLLLPPTAALAMAQSLTPGASRFWSVALSKIPDATANRCTCNGSIVYGLEPLFEIFDAVTRKSFLVRCIVQDPCCYRQLLHLQWLNR